MAVDRRQFLATAGGAVAAGATLVPSRAAARMPGARRRTQSVEGLLAPAPPDLEQAFQTLLGWMNAAGWGGYLLRATGFDLSFAVGAEDGEIFRELARPAAPECADFGGSRAIQPGDPAMSLLYHVLASPAVMPTDAQGRAFPRTAFPDLRQIDLLENYIHSRAKAPDDLDALIPAVFAYEYRPSSKTPHQKHSDLVFARTGVARTGTHPANYDPVHRSYSAEPAGARDDDTAAVTPARFGLFLARRMPSEETSRIGENSLDDGLDFLVPVRKLYNNSPDLRGYTLAFAESHRDEKLSRLAKAVVLPGEDNFQPNAPPFKRVSASRADASGTSRLDGHDTALVELRPEAGCVHVVPTAGPLVQLARQGPNICRFRVPRSTEGTGSNRRYTSLRLVEDPSALAWNFILSDWVFGGGRYTTGLRAPQNVPAFVNIRHRVEDDGRLTHLGATRAGLTEIALGGYWAAMFTDGLCDGCVTAELAPPPGTTPPPPLPWSEILPAFSVVAAPDFFPRFDPNDLSRFDSYFFEGGTETTSGGRLRANPLVLLPGRSEPAFPLTADRRLAMTITAAVSLPPTSEVRTSACSDPRPPSINTLPDTISHVFAPGWDVTYSNDASNPDPRFLATFGLGSPFPEDMKLCAAANGMWAGSSPDAARTFYPDLEPFFLVGRPATAVPLTDAELGFHPDSPAVVEHGADRQPGWDGEHGPYILVQANDRRETVFAINYADIFLSDYVANARGGLLDLGRMRNLDPRNVLDRMDALGRCIRKLPGTDRVRSTDMWLVSAEEVSDWSSGATGLGVPRLLGLHGDDRRIGAAPGIAGAGWLYVFAREHGASRPAIQARRRLQPCRKLYVCQVADSLVRYLEIDSRRHPQAEPRWR